MEKKEIIVKGFARILPKEAFRTVRGKIEFTNELHSLEIYEKKSEAAKVNRSKENFHDIVPVTITYHV